MEGHLERGGYRPSKEELEKEDVDAVIRGAQGNLDRHIRNMVGFWHACRGVDKQIQFRYGQ